MIDDMNHNLQIIPIPAFKDNYIWLIHNNLQAVVVDPGDAVPVLDFLVKNRLALTTILITHHHHDHIDGVKDLLKNYPTATVFAPVLEEYDFEHTPTSENTTVSISGLNLTFAVLDTPGHTLGHIAYYCSEHALLFCGDTLFGAGCGRLFEGTPEQMYQSLLKLAALPPTTKVFCTHEYTMNNINFALTLEPNNLRLIERCNDTKNLRDINMPSLPSSIELELASNPFLRCNNQEIQASLKLKKACEVDIFREIRELRNHY